VISHDFNRSTDADRLIKLQARIDTLRDWTLLTLAGLLIAVMFGTTFVADLRELVFS
jgi:hypothetical protein